jgi:hypothetical protein
MVSAESVKEQLERIDFKQFGWGKAEVRELPSILLPDEQIYECVHGSYEGGFALLVATDVRLLLIDKKILNSLTVEDLRFDMINEIDYSHRLMGAYISISTGSKNLKFRSYNQPRLRKLIGHVQHCMAEAKKKQSSHQEGQNQHLEQINQQLQAYLLAQHQHQEELQRHLISQQQAHIQSQARTQTQIQDHISQQAGRQDADLPISQAVAQTDSQIPAMPAPAPLPPKPDPQLSDYLLAQRLLRDYKQQTQTAPLLPESGPAFERAYEPSDHVDHGDPADNRDDLYHQGLEEIYGKPSRRRRSLSAAASRLLVYLETLKRNSTTSSGRIR